MRREYLAAAVMVGLLAAGSSAMAAPCTMTNQVVGDGTSDTFDNANGTQDVCGNLILGNQSAGNGTYTITGNGAQTSVTFIGGGNSLAPVNVNSTFTTTQDNDSDPSTNANGALVIGNYGIGSFVQGNGSDTGNQVSVDGDLVLGLESGSQGQYTINSGSLTVGGKIVVGGLSTNNNLFTQNGGSVNITGSASSSSDYQGVGNNITGELFIAGGDANIDNGNGEYDISGGSLSVGLIEDGHTGVGIIRQTGGTVNANIWLGNATGSNGTYYLSGSGIINANDEEVGLCCGDTGVFNQSGGTNNASSLALNQYGGGTATYNLSGGALNVTSGDLILGGGGGGSATFNHTGGTLTIGSADEDPDLVIGAVSGDQGLYTLGSTGQATVPSVIVNGDIVVGRDAGSNPGTTPASTDGSMPSVNPNLIIAGDGTSASANNLYVGLNGTGAVTQTDGSIVSISGDAIVGDNLFSAGSYEISNGDATNGQLTVGGTLTVGELGVGTFDQSGGTVSVGGLSIGNGGSSVEPVDQYNLTGSSSVLTVNSDEIVGNLGNGVFVQGSGTDNPTHTIEGTLYIGEGAIVSPDPNSPGDGNGSGPATPPTNPREGAFDLNSGTLSANEAIVADQGIGAFNQTGGTFTVSDQLIVGNQNPAPSPDTNGDIVGGPSQGTYTMTGGTLTANATSGGGIGITIGNFGNGTFSQDGASSVTSGTLNGNEGDLLIGVQSGAQGTYNLGTSSSSTTPSLQVYGDTILGQNSGSYGQLAIGGNGTSASINQYTGYDALNGGNMVVGLGGTGVVTQSDQSSVYLDHDLVIGANPGSSGEYVLEATSTTANSGYNLFIGSDLNVGGFNPQTDIYGYNPQTSTGGSGTFIQDSGDVLVVGSANIGSTGGSAVFEQFGGTLTVNNNLNLGVDGGSGDFYQYTGSTTVGTTAADGNLVLGAQGYNTTGTAGIGNYTIESGNLTVNGNIIIGQDPSSLGTSVMVVGVSGQTPTVVVQSNLSTCPTICDGYLTVGGANNGDLEINSGSVTVQAITYVGGSFTGSGTVTQNGGSFETGYLDVGLYGTGNSYNLNNGTATADVDLVVGNFAGSEGSFVQAGGIVNVNGYGVYINNGNYDLQSGNFNVLQNVTVGDVAGGASFTQEGGSAAIGNTLIVGNSSSVSATYTLSRGTLTTGITGGSSIGDVVIGSSGTGVFNNTGGTEISSSKEGFSLGFYPGSSGTYNLTGTGTLRVAGDEDIGSFGTGVFQQGDGSGNTSNTVAGSLYISGGFGGPSSSYTLTDGTLSVAGDEVVGFAAQGNFTQSGGSNSVTGTLYLGLLSNAPTDPGQFGDGTYTLGGNGSLNVGGDVVLGSGDGVIGTFNFNTAASDNGTLSFTESGQNLIVGDAGTGIFNEGSAANATDLNLQTSGTTLNIGRIAGGTGTFNLAAGSSLEDDMIVGDAGTGTFNNNAGTNTVGTSGTPAKFILGNQSTGIGTYNNNGGSNTINGNLTVGNAGTGTYNLGNGVTGATLSVQGTGLSGGNVEIGQSGTGIVTASNDAIATVAGVLTLGGASPGDFGNGTLTVTGSGTQWTTTGQTLIGGAGTGTLNILAGGYVESDFAQSGSQTSGVVGDLGPQDGSGDPAATGTVTVDGAGSEWNNTGALRVGVFGNGTVTVSNGGLVIDNASTDGAAASVGWQAGSTGTVTIADAASTWTNNGDLNVGDAGTGTVTQGSLTDSTVAGGTVTVTGSLNVGNQSTGLGAYNLTNGGTLSVGSFTTVGAAGTGTFLNDASTHNTEDLVLGTSGGSNGTYTLQDSGVLKVTGAGFLDVGEHGTGKFVQTSGTTTIGGPLDLGRCGGAGCFGSGDTDTGVGSGTVNLSGGSMGVGTFAVVGDQGVGVFNQSGNSTVVVANELDVGRNAGGNGTYNLHGTAALTITSGSLNIGDSDATAAGIFNFNTNGGDNATITFTNPGQSLVVGNEGTGTFNQGGGDLNLTAQSATLKIGANAGSNGNYNLTGGTLEDSLVVGDAGTGTFTNSGGTHTVSGNLTLGNQLTGNGTYNLSSTGSVTVSGNEIVGANGTGKFVQSGGSNSATTGTLIIQQNSGSTGEYDLFGGTLNVANITNNGNLKYTGGTLNPVSTLADNGSITLGATQNITVTSAYTNANFGTGNSFNKLANVTTSGGEIQAAGTIAQTLTGNVSNGTTTTPTLSFGNVHVDTSTTENYQINNVGSGGPSLLGAIQTSVNGGNLTDSRLTGTGVTASNYGPLAQGSATGNLAVTFDASSAGALTGQAVHIANNFGNVAEQTLSITGAAYNLASSSTVAPIVYGVVHVGDGGGSITKDLSITNTAPTGGFSEGLDSSFGSFSGTGGSLITTSGSITNLAAGATNNTSMAVILNTTTAGVVNGTITILQDSNGTIDGLGNTALASQNPSVTGTVETETTITNEASPVINNAPISFGNVREGTVVPTVGVSVTNGAPSSSFTEGLIGNVTGTTGLGITAAGGFGPPTANPELAGQQTNSTSIQVGINTGIAGAQSGNAVIDFKSDGTAFEGGTITDLGDTDVAVSGNVYRLATGSAATPISLGNVRIGGTLAGNISVTNTASTDGYSENLDAAISGTTPQVSSASGSVTGLTAGSSNSTGLQVALNTGTAGAISGTATVQFQSDGTGIDGGAPLNNGSQVVNVTGNVYRLATGSAATPDSLGNVRIGGTLAGNISVTNTASTDGYSENLDASITGSTPQVSSASGSVTGLTAGSSNSTGLQVALNTAAAGAISGTATVQFQSDGTGIDGGAPLNNGSQVVNVTGNVYRLATGSAATVNLGSTRVDGTLAGNITVNNTAMADGFSENLDASITGSTPQVSSTSGSVTGLTAGSSNSTGLQVALSTGTSGAISGTATVQFQSDGTGIDGGAPINNGSQVVNVTGKVYQQAVASVAPNPVDFGIIHVNQAGVQTLTVSNTASAGAYTDVITGGFSSVTGSFTGTGTLGSGVAGGGNSGSALQVGLNVGTAGEYNGTANLSLASHDSDLADVALTTAGVALEAQVNNYASLYFSQTSGQGSLSGGGDAYTLNFGDLLQNSDGGTAGAVLEFLNCPTCNPAFTDLLTSAITDSTGTGFSLSGDSVSDLAGGAGQGGFDISLGTDALGQFDETLTFDVISSDPDYSGDLEPVTLTLQGDVVSSIATNVPEPPSLVILGTAIFGLGLMGFLRRRKRAA